jgi:ABC-type polar amino acid transport system ATPase subunit
MGPGVTPGPMLTIRDLEVRRGARHVVRGVSLDVARGEILAVMGASGAGKTSVLRAVAGLDAIAAGTVAIDGLQLAPGALPRGEALRQLHRRVGMVFQFHHLFEHLTALHNVWLALVHVQRQPQAEAERKARELLEHLGVGAVAEALPRELSGGEAQRVAIARALAVGPPLLLMDEPTASLDPARRGELGATLRQLAAESRTLVVATHDEQFARACAHRVLIMEEGQVVR